MKKWYPLIGGLLVATGFLIGAYFQKNQAGLVSETSKLEEVFRYIEARHVDKISRDSLVEIAIQGTLKYLDPFAVYIPSEWVEQHNEELSGKYSGIGVEFLNVRDTMTISRVLSESPASEAGILAGDQLIKINDQDIIAEKWKMDRLVREVRGPEGTTVSITLRSKGELKEIQLIRKKLITSSIDAALVIAPKVGYIRISRFVATTYRDFMEKLEILIEKKGVKHLVIDLRNNPGGYLEETSKLMNQLIDQKDLLLLTTQGAAQGKREYKTTGRAFFSIDKIVILIDEKSASASEILAGSLQDVKKGVVVGRKSFGKGTVQEQFYLRDGSSIRLSVSRFLLPSGQFIQKDFNQEGTGGITPDYWIEKSFFPSEYRGMDTIFQEDPFILKAIEILK
jgi:carboxyl-terminal processing protease